MTLPRPSNWSRQHVALQKGAWRAAFSDLSFDKAAASFLFFLSHSPWVIISGPVGLIKIKLIVQPGCESHEL